MLHGLLNTSVWQDVIITLILTHITIISVTVYLHRHQAHRALDLHPVISHFFRFWLWLTTGMRTKDWAAIHRKHHAKCETQDDPHSPQILGINKVLWKGAELYRAESLNAETLERYGYGTPDDWIERRLYTPHSAMGITLMFIINVLLFGVCGITMWAVQMLWIPFFAAGVINGIGHYWGYRNFECPDAARNIFPWGIIIGGEELHNNHHTFGTSAKLSVKWWEFDLGWAYIRLFEILRMAKVKRSIPKPILVPHKSNIDADTLKAIIAYRFQIMARYSTEVVLPVIREEKRKAGDAGRAMLSKARALLTRSDNLIDATSKQNIENILQGRDRLQLVYQYRIKLQEIWGKTTATQRELLEALQDWCKQAEATGIEALRSFANNLRRYSLQASVAS